MAYVLMILIVAGVFILGFLAVALLGSFVEEGREHSYRINSSKTDQKPKKEWKGFFRR